MVDSEREAARPKTRSFGAGGTGLSGVSHQRFVDLGGGLVAGGDLVIHNFVRDSIERISAADPSDVQRIAGSQLELLAGYHEIVLAQSRRSFFWALIGAGIGLLFFLAAVVFALLTSSTAGALIPLLSGAIVEVIAGIVFFLYGRAAIQLSSFHGRLETLQRYMLANSICESLDGEERTKARAALIQEISRAAADGRVLNS
jgi:hypothetical protein